MHKTNSRILIRKALFYNTCNESNIIGFYENFIKQVFNGKLVI